MTPSRWLAVPTVATLAFLAACSGSDPIASDGDASEIVVAIREGDNGVAPMLVERWNELNPETPARVEHITGSADEQRRQLSLELDSGGSSFDVLGLDVVWTGEFAANGWIDELEAGSAQDIWEGSLDSGWHDGKQYAMPLLLGAGLLYYRTDLVDEAPTSWQGLVESGTEAASGSGLDAFVAQGASYEGLAVNYLELLWGAGGDLFNEDRTEVVFGGEPAEKALQFMRDSYDAGVYAPGFNTMTETEARASFDGGQSVFMRHWANPYHAMATAEGSAIEDLFSIAPLPTFDGSGSASTLGGINLALSSNSDEPEESAAFITWATSDPEAQSILAENGNGPVLKSTYEDPAFADDVMLQTLKAVLPDAKSRPSVPKWAEISIAMQQEVFDGYTGQQSIDEAVEAISEVLKDSLR